MSRTTIEGMDRTLRALGLMPRAMLAARNDVLRKWADDTLESAKRFVPIRTGALKRSLDKEVREPTGDALVGDWSHNTLEYAIYVERGTSSMEAEPYLKPAFYANRGHVAANMAHAIATRLGAL